MSAEPREAPRRAVVTGASSGIGAAVCAALGDRGWEVFGLSRRDPGSGEPGSGSDDGEASTEGVVPQHYVPIDLADLDALPHRAEALVEWVGGPDAVVLAAGGGLFGALEQLALDRIRTAVDVHLTANLILCRALLPAMKRRGTGTLVLMGSEASLRGARQGAVYCAVKFGLRGLAQALRDECAKSGVRVTIVHPGMVRTPFFDQLHFEPGPEPENALEAEDVADAVLLALEAPQRAVVDEIELSPLKRVVHRKS